MGGVIGVNNITNEGDKISHNKLNTLSLPSQSYRIEQSKEVLISLGYAFRKLDSSYMILRGGEDEMVEEEVGGEGGRIACLLRVRGRRRKGECAGRRAGDTAALDQGHLQEEEEEEEEEEESVKKASLQYWNAVLKGKKRWGQTYERVEHHAVKGVGLSKDAVRSWKVLEVCGCE